MHQAPQIGVNTSLLISCLICWYKHDCLKICLKNHTQNVFGGQLTRPVKKEYNFTYLKTICLYKHVCLYKQYISTYQLIKAHTTFLNDNILYYHSQFLIWIWTFCYVSKCSKIDNIQPIEMTLWHSTTSGPGLYVY